MLVGPLEYTHTGAQKGQYIEEKSKAYRENSETLKITKTLQIQGTELVRWGSCVTSCFGDEVGSREQTESHEEPAKKRNGHEKA